ncbi:MAG: hypothetical protein ACI920_003444, partial [Saprospiraceae bacterium]
GSVHFLYEGEKIYSVVAPNLFVFTHPFCRKSVKI